VTDFSKLFPFKGGVTCGCGNVVSRLTDRGICKECDDALDKLAQQKLRPKPAASSGARVKPAAAAGRAVSPGFVSGIEKSLPPGDRDNCDALEP
jgi:hypothetical protein